LFGIEEDVVARALDVAGNPEPELDHARVEVFREEGARELFDRLATPEGYRRFVEGLGSVGVRSSGEGRFEATIVSERGDSVLETAHLDREANVLSIERTSGLRRTGFRLEKTDAGERLVRYADLPDAREEFLSVDAGRGRIAGILAMDLVALSRL
jgi:hypothetical protein